MTQAIEVSKAIPIMPDFVPHTIPTLTDRSGLPYANAKPSESIQIVGDLDKRPAHFTHKRVYQEPSALTRIAIAAGAVAGGFAILEACGYLINQIK